MRRAVALGLFVSLALSASAEIVISEWMYNGAGPGGLGEFVEFTNTGPSPVDMTGWSYDDDSRVPGTVSLSAFGVVAPGQSVILTDDTASNFAAVWGLSGVLIIGGNTSDLGRNDEINLFDAGGSLVDRLTFGDEALPGTVRTLRRSCNIPWTDFGFMTAQSGWTLAEDGDAYGSRVSARGEVGSPGSIVGYARTDLDRDGDVDWTDFDTWTGCFGGPAVPYDPPPAGCSLDLNAAGTIAADADQDGDVDLADLAVFQSCFSGAGNAADPTCGLDAAPPVVTYIDLLGDSIAVTGDVVTVAGTTATITSRGTYVVTGVLTDGQIVVDSSSPGLVQVILNGVDISNSTTAPLYVLQAAQTEILLVEQTFNFLDDPETYVYPDPNDAEPNAALFSHEPLVISGPGTLTVHGNFNDGIASKDSLIIAGGTLNVTAIDDGIRGKDYLAIDDGQITVTAGGDALKSDNAVDPGLGYVMIEDGLIDLTCGGDAVTAATDVTITGGNFTVLAGGGHTVTIPADASAKGIKGVTRVRIDGGTLDLDCADDGVHSNDAVSIRGGNLTIATNSSTTASYGDAIHADSTLDLSGGIIIITSCYEGIEAAAITISDGDIHVTSSDDAITADATVTITGGDITILSGGGHTVTIPSSSSAKGIKGLTNVTIDGGIFNLDCADDGIHSDNTVTIGGGDLTIATNSSTTASYGDGIHAETALHVTGGSGTNNFLHINDGYLAVYAAGDGIDVNGSITMTGGTVIVRGPTVNNNSAIDYDVSFNISGGFLVAAGSAGMAQAPSTTSTQRSVKITYSANKPAGTLVHIETTATPHAEILTFAPAKQYRSVVFSSPALTQGTSYDLYRGGSCDGSVTDGLYQSGTYTPGVLTNTFITNNIVTNVNAP